MDKGDLVVVTSSINATWAVRRRVEHGEVGLIMGPSEEAVSRTMMGEDRWWRILLEDGAITLPAWAMSAL
jgi:hypothetical protein